MNEEPILSIVIANYNYGAFLRSALESIIDQCDEPILVHGRAALPVRGTSSAIEVIICDAASTDNSVEVVRAYEKNIAWWCSEKDGGQSEAFNKGFFHAAGKWLTWLNADEIYFPGMLKAFLEFGQKHPKAEWVAGNDVSFRDCDRRITHVSWGAHRPNGLLQKSHSPFAVFGPTSFFKKALYERVGPIDESLHFAMDFDYWIRLTMAGVVQYRLNRTCWAFRVHDKSKTSGERASRQLAQRENEFKGILARHGYSFRYSMTNPWYVLWMVGRLLDGSLFMRAWKRFSMNGRKIDEFL